MRNLPYPNNRGQTHFKGCYRERHHHNCAVVEADHLRALLMDSKYEIKRLKKMLKDRGVCFPADEYLAALERSGEQ
jgi:hypothetical protein